MFCECFQLTVESDLAQNESSAGSVNVTTGTVSDPFTEIPDESDCESSADKEEVVEPTVEVTSVSVPVESGFKVDFWVLCLLSLFLYLSFTLFLSLVSVCWHLIQICHYLERRLRRTT